MLEYLTYFQNRRVGLRVVHLKPFTDPTSQIGYNDQPITHDLITDVYLEFVRGTQQEESNEYCKTLTGE